MTDEELLTIYDEERDYYYCYLRAVRGEDAQGRPSPARIRATKSAWHDKWRAREAAGLSWSAVVALLERAGRTHRKESRRARR